MRATLHRSVPPLLLVLAGRHVRALPTPPRTASLAAGRPDWSAKQSLGQNFLVDQAVARRIVGSLEDSSEEGSGVLELGPGQGALTRHALERWPRMSAVEIDRRAIATLAEQLPSLRVQQGNMLDVRWAEAAAACVGGTGRVSVLSNPPYYCTAELLLSLMLGADHIERAVLTLQREAVERLTSPHGRKQYSALGVVYHLFADVEVLFDVPPHAFSPAPKVTSTCIRVTYAPPSERESLKAVHTLARAAFSTRRKMLRQSLRPLLAGLPTRADGSAAEVPAEFGALRAEQLEPAQFCELARALGLLP